MNYFLRFMQEREDGQGWSEQTIMYNDREIALINYKTRTTGDYWKLHRTDIRLESEKGTIIRQRSI